jgi:hypothetical protein
MFQKSLYRIKVHVNLSLKREIFPIWKGRRAAGGDSLQHPAAASNLALRDLNK